MLFNSYEFIFVFLPAVLIVYYLAARRSPEAAIGWTIAASFAFYSWWNIPFALIPALSILFNYQLGCAILRASQERSRWLFIAGLIGNLAVLGYYKYADFLLSQFGRTGAASAPFVPLALSFTTFVQIAFLADARRRAIDKLSFGPYALFVSFFPHLIAGPIVRWNELGPQIFDSRTYAPQWPNIAAGLTFFTFGLAKKVVLADGISVHVNPVFDAAAQGQALPIAAAWAGTTGYALQLYFDFSGYSDMAIGLGLLFNLRLPINFDSPYRAGSLTDFWRRWHISLSRFLRDYLYIPLGGNRRGPLRRAANLLLTMTLAGLWHGAGWTFVLWGAMHGLGLVVNHAWRDARARLGMISPLPGGKIVGWLLTFAFVLFGWVLFRSASLDAALLMLNSMIGLAGAPPAQVLHLDHDQWIISKGLVTEAWLREWFGAHWSVRGTVWTLGLLAFALVCPNSARLMRYHDDVGAAPPRRARLAWRPSPLWLLAVAVILLFTIGQIGRVKEFLYYQF